MKITQPRTRLFSQLTVDADVDMLTLYQLTQLASPGAGEALRKGNQDITNAEIDNAAAIAITKLGAGRFGLDRLNWASDKILVGAGAGDSPNEIDVPGPTVIVKSADQIVNNSTVHIDDTDLKFAVSANDLWDVTLYLKVIPPGTACRIRYNWTIPAGASLEHFNKFGAIAAVKDGTDDEGGNLTVDVHHYFYLRYLYIGGANAGDVQLTWAQQIAVVTNLTVEQNSFIIANKLS